MRRKIERYGLARKIEPRHFFPTVEAAVTAFRARSGAEWTPARSSSADGTAPGHRLVDAAPPDAPVAPPSTRGRDS